MYLCKVRKDCDASVPSFMKCCFKSRTVLHVFVSVYFQKGVLVLDSYTDDIIIILNFIVTGLQGYEITPGLR